MLHAFLMHSCDTVCFHVLAMYADFSSPDASIMSEEGPRLYRIWDVSQKTIKLMENRLIATPRSSNEPGNGKAVNSVSIPLPAHSK